MSTPIPPNNPQRRTLPLTLRVLGGAFLLSTLFFAVALNLVGALEAVSTDVGSMLMLPLALAATGIAAACLYLRSVLLTRAAAVEAADGRLAAVLKTFIVVFALAEAVGIQGLVLGLLGGSSAVAYALIAAGAALVLASWPRHLELERLFDGTY